MRQVVLDTETTGLDADNGDRIVEIGCVEIVNRRLTGRSLHRHVNPMRRNSEAAFQVHGLSDEFLATQPEFSDVCDELLAFVSGAELIIHNAAFDVGFINAELKRLNKPLLATHIGGIVDSMLLSRELFPGKSASLDALCKRLEVDNSSRTLHGALLDAQLLAEVYVRMTRGQHELQIAQHEGASGPQHAALPEVDLAGLQLAVRRASLQELEAHQSMLERLDRDSGGKTLWRQRVGVA